MCNRAEFSIRSDGIMENFLPRQGTESARCTIFRSDAVVFFGRIPLVGRSVEGSVRWASVRCPASLKNMYQIIRFNNFQYSQDVLFMFTIFSLVQKNNQNFVFAPLKKHLILILSCGGYKWHWKYAWGIIFTQLVSKLNIIQSCAEGNNIYIKCTFWLYWKL